MANHHQENNDLEAAYRRATLFQHASTTVFQRDKTYLKEVARNTTLVPHWIGSTDCFWYRRDTEAGVQFRLVNAKNKTNDPAFDHQALAGALSESVQQPIDADNLPIAKVSISLSPVQIHFVAFDNHYCFDAESKQCRLFEPELDAHSRKHLLSPDGKKIAFARDYNLWMQDVETGEERALTQDGESKYFYATSPISWGHALNPDLQARWSPDSRRLFTVQTDNRQIKQMPIIDYVPQDGSIRPMLYQYPSASPGDDHVEEQRILAINVETGRQQEVNYRRVPVNRSGFGLFSDNQGWWSTDSRHAYFVDMEIGDQLVRVVKFDTNTGATRILFEETTDTHIQLSPNRDDYATIFPIPATEELIWYSTRSGRGHLYLYDLKSGKLKHAITQGDWVVRSLLYFDSERRELWFQSSGRVPDRDPYYLDVCRVNIDTCELITVVSSDHEYTVIDALGGKNIFSMIHKLTCLDSTPTTCGPSPNGLYLVATRSRVDQTPITVLLDRQGETLLELDSADISGLPNNWQWPEPVKTKAADGNADIYGVLFRPSDFSKDKKYPVIDISHCTTEISGVPKGSFNNAEMGGEFYLQAAALAELGFIVVTLDGRGTTNRHKSFFDYSHCAKHSANLLEDRIAGIQQLSERYPYMDLERVGVIGFNGTPGAVFGLLKYPDFYKVGVNHALQDPRVNSALANNYTGIIKSSDHKIPPEKLVNNLKGKLLLMHGLLDRVDHPAATWRLVDALQKANKDFDMLIFPHEGITAHIGSDYAFRRTWDYFVQHLRGIDPPKEFDFFQ